jgi:hypothetical protein
MGPVAHFARAASADDLLTLLASVPVPSREHALGVCSARILRSAADLLGADSAGLGKKACIRAILANF